VFFINDFGRMFYVLWTDQSADKRSLEDLTADIRVGDMVRSKEVVDTARGPQVRVAGVEKDGSPMKVTKLRDGKLTEGPLDLGKASSMFLHGSFFYEVTAGVTRVRDDMTDEMLLENANTMLDGALGGMTFPNP
jgi:sensor domain CHASE-containing protein